MTFAITEDHRSLAGVARSFAASADLRRATRETLSSPVEGRGTSWKQICDLGWTGLHLPEDGGGSGYGLAELAVVVEELGAAVAPGPFLPAVIGSAVLARLVPDSALLPAVAEGSTVAVYAPSAGPVPGALWADHLLIGVGDDVLLLAAADVTLTPVDALDTALGAARVEVDPARGTRLPGLGALALAVARTLAAAEAAGSARATLAMALEYAKVREQFGRTIGSFQAIKHHLADMLIRSEAAAAVAWDAAAACDDGTAGRQAELAGATAATVALEAAQLNAQMNIQVHGGIGFTWEHDAHLYLRRALTLRAVFGAGAAQDVHDLAAAGVRRGSSVALPPEAEQFRTAAREFLAAHAGAPDRTALVESGYLVPHWPAPWGRGAGPVEQLVIEQEFAGVDVPALGIGGWNLLTVSQHGAPEQVERWLRPGLSGELVWCQLFSEPNAGSDAAAVQTRAVRVDGGWRITGQKVWTSGAHECDRGLATVRTDPAAPKHKGITAVVVDLHAAGVEIRPLRQITGGTEFNEVFFDDVFVPDEDVVGLVNDGWRVARATLGNERVSIGGNYRRGSTAFDLVGVLARYAPDDAGLRRDVGRLIADDQAKRSINLRQIARAVAGAEPGAEGNVTKQLIADHAQALTELALRILGPAAVDGSEPTLTREYLGARALTIAGGTSEIARNVIAERLLGLPRDPLNR